MYLMGGQNFSIAPIPGPCTEFSIYFGCLPKVIFIVNELR